MPTGWATPPGIPEGALDSIRSEFIKQWRDLTESAVSRQLPAITDRRFASPAWSANPSYLMMAHFYLLSAKSMQRMVDASDADQDMKERLRFSIMQWLDAMSPANFLITNPDAQGTLLKTGGESIVAGMNNFFADSFGEKDRPLAGTDYSDIFNPCGQEDILIDQVLNAAKVTEKTVSYDELLKQGAQQ